jgi:ankyrin repeat protein
MCFPAVRGFQANLSYQLRIALRDVDYATFQQLIDANGLQCLGYYRSILYPWLAEAPIGMARIVLDNPESRKVALDDVLLFCAAISADNLELAQLLVDNGFQIVDRSFGFMSPLVLAIQNNNLDTVQWLLDQGFKCYQHELSWAINHHEIAMCIIDHLPQELIATKALPIAAAAGQGRIALELLRRGASAHSTDEFGRNALHSLANSRYNTTRCELLAEMVLHEGLVNATCSQLMSPLHYIASEKYSPDKKAFINTLINSAADVNATDRRGQTPLHHLCSSTPNSNNGALVDLLIASHANVNVLDRTRWSAFKRACQSGCKWSASVLVAVADVHIGDVQCDANSVLHYACLNGLDSIVTKLLHTEQCSMYINQPNAKQRVPLYYAAIAANVRLVSELLDANALPDANAQQPEQQQQQQQQQQCVETPLHAAAARGHKFVVQLLLDRRASIDRCDANGRTALHLAATNGHKSTIELLLKRRACVNAIDSKRMTPLHLATSRNERSAALLLVEFRADINIRDCVWPTRPIASKREVVMLSDCC